MSISAVNAATSAYGVANQSSKVTSSNQSGNVAQTTQADLVSLSPEAIAAQRQEQYALKDAQSLFKDWQNAGLTFRNYAIGHGGTSEMLLRENQKVVDSLNILKSHAPTPEAEQAFEDKIQFVILVGNKEIFNSMEDIDKRIQAQNDYQSLAGQYLTEQYGSPDGKLPDTFAAHLRNENGDVDFSKDPFLNTHPRLSSFIESENQSKTIQSKAINTYSEVLAQTSISFPVDQKALKGDSMNLLSEWLDKDLPYDEKSN